MCFTCDVVEVVEAVEVQAAGLLVRRVRALPADAGRPQRVRRPDSVVGSGAGLKQKRLFKKPTQTYKKQLKRLSLHHKE